MRQFSWQYMLLLYFLAIVCYVVIPVTVVLFLLHLAGVL